MKELLNKINDKIDEWCDSNSNLELYEYLNMSKLEYNIFLLDVNKWYNIYYINDNDVTSVCHTSEGTFWINGSDVSFFPPYSENV